MESSAGTARSGRLVILVGPDGVGKTTIARGLIACREPHAAYFHFLPPVLGPLPTDPGPLAPPPPKARGRASRVLGWMRLSRNAARCWAGYLGTVRPALRRGWLVVGDRWMYGYLVQPHALKFSGPQRLARAVLRLLPRPDLVVNLAAPAELIHARKQELTVSQIERELHAWSSLPVGGLLTLDATAGPSHIVQQIVDALALPSLHDERR